MMEGSLKNRDSKLYVLYTSTEDTAPVRQLLWWPVLEIRSTGYERPEAGDIATSTGGGEWKTRNPSTHRGTGSVSTGTGSTPPETVERVSVNPPSAGGKELRWHYGRWEKLLAKGWVPAGEGKETPKAVRGKAKVKSQDTVSRRLSRRSKFNLFDKAGRLVGDVSAYSAEEAVRLAGGPGVATARLADD